jgi:hypothetical protein
MLVLVHFEQALHILWHPCSLSLALLAAFAVCVFVLYVKSHHWYVLVVFLWRAGCAARHIPALQLLTTLGQCLLTVCTTGEMFLQQMRVQRVLPSGKFSASVENLHALCAKAAVRIKISCVAAGLLNMLFTDASFTRMVLSDAAPYPGLLCLPFMGPIHNAALCGNFSIQMTMLALCSAVIGFNMAKASGNSQLDEVEFVGSHIFPLLVCLCLHTIACWLLTRTQVVLDKFYHNELDVETIKQDAVAILHDVLLLWCCAKLQYIDCFWFLEKMVRTVLVCCCCTVRRCVCW